MAVQKARTLIIQSSGVIIDEAISIFEAPTIVASQKKL